MRKSLLVATLALCLCAAVAHAADSPDQGAPNMPLGTYDTTAGGGLKNPLQPSSNFDDYGVQTAKVDYGSSYEPPSDYGMGQCRTMAFGRDYTFTLEGHATGFSAKCEYKQSAKPTAGSAY